MTGPQHQKMRLSCPVIIWGVVLMMGGALVHPAWAGEDGHWQRVELILGFADGAEGEVTVAPGTVRASGEIAPLVGLGYLRCQAGQLAYSLSLQALSLDSEVVVAPGTVETSSSTATALHLGVRYYLSTPADGPYLAAAVGPVIGRESSTRVGTGVVVDSHSETVISGGLALGLDFPVSGPFGVAAEAAYLVTGDFSEPIAGRSNASGAQFALRLGWTFGKP